MFDRTSIQRIVKSAFEHRRMGQGKICDELNALRTPQHYLFGKNPYPDYLIVKTMLNDVRLTIVRLIPLIDSNMPLVSADAALLDIEDEDAQFSVESVSELGELIRIAQVLYVSALSYQPSYGKPLPQTELEHRPFARSSFRTQETRRVLSWLEFLHHQQSFAEIGSRWSKKLQAAELIDFPELSEEQVKLDLDLLMTSDNLAEVSKKAWGKLVRRMAAEGETILRQEQAIKAYNELTGVSRDQATSQFALVCSEYREEMRRHDYWIRRYLEPLELLAHTGLPLWLADSPEWRTAESNERVREANAQIQLHRALEEETVANAARAEAERSLEEMRQRMAEMQLKMAGMQASLRHEGYTKSQTSQETQKSTSVESDVSADLQSTKTPETASAKYSVNTISTRGRATSFRPRG